MDYRHCTEAYYSKWIGVDGILHAVSDRPQFVYSPERNAAQPGYSQPFDLYILAVESGVFCSYGDRAAPFIERIRAASADDAKSLVSCAEAVVRQQFGHNRKYLYVPTVPLPCAARPLTPDECGEYLTFFNKCNPGCGDTDWVADYFAEMAHDRLCCGVFADGALVSCTDAPDMPYMPDAVQEIGINTLPEYRGRGYAAEACRAAAAEIVRNGKCPMWSTAIDNVASQRLAAQVGFVPFAEVYTVTI